MTEVLIFILGMSSVSTIYEIAKTSKSSKSNSMRNSKDYFKRILK